MNYAAAIDDPVEKRPLLEEVVECNHGNWQRTSMTAESNLAEEDCARGDYDSAGRPFAACLWSICRRAQIAVRILRTTFRITLRYLTLIGEYAAARGKASSAPSLPCRTGGSTS